MIIKLSMGKESIVDDDFLIPPRKFSTKPHGKTFYAKCNDIGGRYLHHYVCGYPLKGYEVDHIDGNGLNNQRSNLRIVTRRQNMQNQHGVSKTSKYPGVYWNPAANKWQAYCCIKNQTKYLGVYS